MVQSAAFLIQLEARGDAHHLSRGRTVLITARDGAIGETDHEGLWVFDTRVLSRYVWQVGGSKPTFSAMSAVEQNRDLLYYIFAPPECKKNAMPGCDAAQNAVEIRIERRVGEGMLEEVTITNHTQLKTSFPLELSLAADFAAPSEAEGKRRQHGRLTKHWSTGKESAMLTLDYRAAHRYHHQGEAGRATFHRGIRLQVTNDQRKPEFSAGLLRFRVRLKPRQVWRASLAWTAQLAGRDLPLPRHAESVHEEKWQEFIHTAAHFTAPQGGSLTGIVLRTVQQSVTDLAALRMYDLDGEDALGPYWVPAAGIPMYVGLFDRDVLFSAREAAVCGTEVLRGTLAVLSRHLGSAVNDWRDEQPGRFVHEMHTGPLAELNYEPHGRYFGSVTGSIYYPSALSTLWKWTGSREIVSSFIEPARRGLAWADKYSRDASGFYKYKTRSRQGEKNQGWKDSADAIVYPDGSQVDAPLGTCEMQAFVYASKLAMAEILWSTGEKDEARRLDKDASELKKRFNDFFWMAEESYVAMGIDRRNRAIRSVGSDPGHCLLHGIVESSLQQTVGRRLMAEDMFSGWGVRTLSANHPAYNPFSYHCGSVWPVENGAFVLALARCGLHAEMQQLAKALFEAAALFKYCRLPEVFAGHPRDEAHPFPGMYPKANSPQAWSATAPIMVLEALLGLQPYAPMQLLLLDPHLPEWLPELSVHRLRVGGARVSLRFWRDGLGATAFEITELEGVLRVVRYPNLWALITGSAEAVRTNLAEIILEPARKRS